MRDKEFYVFYGVVIGVIICFAIYFISKRLMDSHIETPYISEQLIACEGYCDLFYDPHTQITYVYKTGQCLSPYYAPNGKPYLWDGCNLVIIPED